MGSADEFGGGNEGKTKNEEKEVFCDLYMRKMHVCGCVVNARMQCEPIAYVYKMHQNQSHRVLKKQYMKLTCNATRDEPHLHPKDSLCARSNHSLPLP